MYNFKNNIFLGIFAIKSKLEIDGTIKSSFPIGSTENVFNQIRN